MAGILSGPIDAPPEDRLAKVYPKVEAVAGMALTHRASGFSGSLVRLEGGGAEIRGRTGLERVFRLAPGAFSVDGRAVSLVRPAAGEQTVTAAVTASGRWRGPVPRPGWPGPGACGWRASTTPSWSSGCGATTCGSKGWWSSVWTASTIWPVPHP